MIKNYIKEINAVVSEPIMIMEVCGTHTHEIARSGIQSLLTDKINIRSGPGCPVCVTSHGYIDAAINLAKKGVIITTFGDLLAVKGSEGSMQDLQAEGYDVRVLYSPKDLIPLALKHPLQEIVFCGVGFETTAPVIAAVIEIVKEKEFKNVSFLISLKRMEPILRKVLQNNKISGIICPGHVAAIVGADYFRFISEEYHISSVICGFGVTDIVGGIYWLSHHYKEGSFLNLYNRIVTDCGNKKAMEMINKVFQISDDYWRGIGLVQNSGYCLKKEYHQYDAKIKYNLDIVESEEVDKCICKEIILGKKEPIDCMLFRKVCNPQNPMGPCMVSSEGTCLAYYKYRVREQNE